MLFSIIIPVYNTEQYLRKCIDSIVNQQFDNYEIIIINDDSPDNSLSIIEEYCNKYSQIRCICQETNKGLLHARITGVEHACGDYLMSIDSDDYLIDNNALFKLSEAIKKTHADIIQYGIQSSDGNWSDWFDVLTPKYINSSKKIHTLYFKNSIKCSTLWSRIINRELYLSIIPYFPKNINITMSEDFLQTSLLMYLANSYYAITDQLYCYRIHQGDVSQHYTNKSIVSAIKSNGQVLQILHQYLPTEYYIIIRDKLLNDSIEAILANQLETTVEQNIIGLLIQAFGAESVISVIFSQDITIQTNLLNLIKWQTLQLPPIQNRKKIGLITYNMYFGGGEKIDSIFLCELHKKGYDVTLFTTESPNVQDFKYPDNITRIQITDHIKSIYKECQNIINTYDIDLFIIHDHDISVFYAYMVALTCLGQKIIVNNHHDLFYHKDIEIQRLFNRYAIYQTLYPNLDAITYLIPYNIDYLQLSGIKQALLVSNPLEFTIDNTPLSTQDNKTIIWCGRWDDVKRPMDVLEAFALAVPKLAQDVTLIILGSGSLHNDMEHYIKKHRLSDRVILPGFVDPKPYYQHASLHIMTSLSEAFPTVIAETKAYGIATVMYELPDIAFYGSAGLISLPQKDTKSLSEEIIFLMNNPNKLKKIGQEARNSLKAFSTENTMNRWDEIIDNVCHNTLLQNQELVIEPTIEQAKYVVQKLNNYNRLLVLGKNFYYSKNQLYWLKLFDLLKKIARKCMPPNSFLRKKMYLIIRYFKKYIEK